MNRIKIVILVISLALLSTLTHAEIINVPDDFETIQTAINESEDGDTVLVQPGMYQENIDFSGKDIVVGSLYLTTDDSAYIDSTVIYGDSGGSVVTFENGETEEAVLVGFTVRNGNNGGIYCRDNSSPNISNCRITRNFSKGGGGIYCRDNSNPIIRDCTITENFSHEDCGGGIKCRNSRPLIIDCIISGNEAGDGGGLCCWDGSNVTIKECIITGNTAFGETGNGGGIWCESRSTLIIESSVITDNDCFSIGGAIFGGDETYLVVVGCTISENGACLGGGIYSSNSAIIVNSILWNDADQEIEDENPVVRYSNVQGGFEGEGNIDLDPLFVDPDNDNFHLTENSPCIDTGTAFFVWDNDTLVDMSEDEYAGDAPDMGAFEYGFVSVDPGSVNPPFNFTLLPNYPNPFNSATTIRYSLPHPTEVTLCIYNPLGQQVGLLSEGYQHPGIHTATLTATNLPSGLYFVRLEASGQVLSRKLMLLK